MNSTQRDFAISPCMSHEAAARDEELVLSAKAGSHEAFAKLQQSYSHRLYKRILSITRNREDAEDALQDTFFRAYLALPSFEGRAKFSSWLTRIAINSALMTIRRRRARPETSFERQSLGDEALFFDLRDGALNPEQAFDQKQRSQAILHSIQRLDPKLRTPIHIWISQQCSMKDIARNLGISLASVKSRLHRARKRLIRSPTLRNLALDLIRADRTALNMRLQNRDNYV
jgi:RNA polymerase sigma-70 factor, ECF subfamily